MKPQAIIGAGLAGLLAAHHFRNIPIFEAGKQKENHQALLRFRTAKVAELTGIKFKEVQVRKSIWDGTRHLDKCDIQAANAYSKKVLGKVVDGRSIWKLDTVSRYVAPTDFYWRLTETLKSRIEYESVYDFGQHAELKIGEQSLVINTAPLPIVLKSLGLEVGEEFKRAPIIARRYALPDCEGVYQTVYFPFANNSVYRASITDCTLIVESVREPCQNDMMQVFRAFGLDYNQSAIYSTTPQEYGKILDIERLKRRHLMSKLTDDYGIYSLGRFATWRNILLDDVVDDIAAIDNLVGSDEYSKKLYRKC